MMFAVGLPWRDGGSDQVWSRWYRRLCGRLFFVPVQVGQGGSKRRKYWRLWLFWSVWRLVGKGKDKRRKKTENMAMGMRGKSVEDGVKGGIG